MSARLYAPRSTTVAEVLAQAGLTASASAAAIDEGRVFLGRARVGRLAQAVPAGAEVVVHAPRVDVALPAPFVLSSDEDLLVVDKPAGIPTVPDTVGARGSLLDHASRAVSRPRDALHPTSRLDRDVSGVVTFALTTRGADALAAAREHGRYVRRYVAIACGALPDHARWTWAIARARDPRLRRAVDATSGRAMPTSDAAKPAATRVRVCARAQVGRAWFSLLALAPETGRTHQLRVHAAAAGAPLAGDRDYGAPPRLTTSQGKVLGFGRVALHCARVEVFDARHGDCIVRASSPVPPELVELARALGLGDFEEALACEL